MKIRLLFLIFILGCSDDVITERPINVCEGEVQSDGIEPFVVDINNSTWIPNQSIFGTYYDGKLFVNATDSSILDGIWRTIDIEIDSPFIGRNDVAYSAKSHLSMRQIENRFGFTGFVSCGFVNLTELDTVDGTITGTFQGIIDPPDNDFDITLTDGIFSNLKLTNLFCEPTFIVEPIEIDIYNDWLITGIYNKSESLISFPPCSLAITLTFSLNNNLTGKLGNNPYWADFILKSTSEISITSIGSFRGSATDYEYYFQQLFFQELGNTDLTFKTQNNTLILTNLKSGNRLKFVLLN